MDPMRIGQAVVLLIGAVGILIVLFLAFMVWRTAWNVRRRLCPACCAVDIRPREGYDKTEGTSRSDASRPGESHGPETRA